MIKKKDLLAKAVKHTGSETGFIKFAQDFLKESGPNKGTSLNRSLFSTLSAVIKAAPENTLECLRDILKQVSDTEEKSFNGVNTAYLKKLIMLLFHDRESLLPDDAEGFKEYRKAELFAYVEICRRYFIVAQSPAKSQITQNEGRKSVTYEVKSATEIPRLQTNVLASSAELMRGNRQCAEYILQNKNNVKFKSLANAAAKVMKGEN